MSSPLIQTVVKEPSGCLVGRENVGNYWKKGLEGQPDLRFDLIQILIGVDSITLYYKNQKGRFSAEVLIFDENERNKVKEGRAHYNSPPVAIE